MDENGNHEGEPKVIESHVLDSPVGRVVLRVVALNDAVFLCTEPKFLVSDLNASQIDMLMRTTDEWMLPIAKKTLDEYSPKGSRIYCVHRARNSFHELFLTQDGLIGSREAKIEVE